MTDYKFVENVAQYVPMDELELLENNPRTITKENFEKLKKSVGEFKNFFEGRPCLANKVGDAKPVIFAGNQRYRAAKELGWTEVPCVIYQNLSKEEQKRLTIKDNVELGSWDFEMLANEYDDDMLTEEGVKLLEPDFTEIDGNEDREVNRKLQRVTCPKCGEEFEI